MRDYDGTRAVVSGLSRRSFLVGGSTLFLGPFAAACGGAQTSSGGGSSIDTFTAVMQGSGAGEGIDPGTDNLFIDEARLKALYDGLFEVDDQMRPVPRLAESAEPSPDGRKWRLKLRDARWHDGKKFTAADVLYTFARVLGPAQTKSFVAASTVDQIDLAQSRAVDDRTVEVTLKQPSFDFLTALAAYGTRIVQDGATDFSTAVGTGPFKFESFTPGRQLVATAYEHYWDGAPQIQQLKILSVDTNAQLSIIQGGQADYADDIPASAAKTLRDTDDITVNTTRNSGIYYFAMKTDRLPFDNADVRRALMLMVNREELVRVALEGEAEVANDVFGKGTQYYAGDLPQHRYDPDGAKALLRKAGAENLTFDLYTAPAANGFVEAAHLFAEQAKACGVTVNVIVGSEDGYYTNVLTTGHVALGQSGPLPAANHFGSRLLTGSPQNRTMWSDPEFDRLYAQAQGTASESERTGIYHQMHELLYDRGGFLFWANSHWNNAAKSKFKNIPTGVPNSLNWARFDKVSL